MVLVLIIPLYAQQNDTTNVENIHEIKAQLDSLQKTIRSLNDELQRMKQNRVEKGSDFFQLNTFLDGEDVESVNVESRSRRRQVDAILKAIFQRPGQLRFNGSATTILQQGFDQNSRHTTGVGSFDIYAHTSLGPSTLLFFDLEAIGGNGPDEFYPNFAGLNGDAGSTQAEDGADRLTVLEAWAEFSILNKRFTITAGKIDITNYFDNNASANDETMQFLSNSFVNSAAFAVPGNSPGIRLRTTLFDQFHLQAGVAKTHNSGSELFKNIYKIASLGFTLFPRTNFKSNFRFFGYLYPLPENAAGWGISFDKVVFGAYNIFARYGKNEAKIAEYWGIQSAWSAGTRFVKKIAGKHTVLGLAYGENEHHLINLKNEQIIEFYARRQLNKWTHLSPHLQIVWNLGGLAKKVTIIGIRTHFNF